MSVSRGRLDQGNLYKGEDVWIVDWIEYWMDRAGGLYVWGGLSTCTGAGGTEAVTLGSPRSMPGNREWWPE